MAIVIGVRFERESKISYFDPSEVWPRIGDGVIVDSARGAEYGVVAMSAREVSAEHLPQPLYKVLRLATSDDMQRSSLLEGRAREAIEVCQEKVEAHKLDMKLIDAEVAFDGSKIVFFFTANGRIDFRELVKDLASVFKTRIELRQIGVRDEARMLGGLGPCGRPICCGSFLANFQPVSIKMAKEQGLSLNPTKISGLCGRLMCCLKYEQDCYEDTLKRLPKVGRDIQTPDGLGVVAEINPLREKVKARIRLEDGTFDVREYDCDAVSRPAPNARPAPAPQSVAEPTADSAVESAAHTAPAPAPDSPKPDTDGVSTEFSAVVMTNANAYGPNDELDDIDAESAQLSPATQIPEPAALDTTAERAETAPDVVAETEPAPKADPNVSTEHGSESRRSSKRKSRGRADTERTSTERTGSERVDNQSTFKAEPIYESESTVPSLTIEEYNMPDYGDDDDDDADLAIELGIHPSTPTQRDGKTAELQPESAIEVEPASAVAEEDIIVVETAADADFELALDAAGSYDDIDELVALDELTSAAEEKLLEEVALLEGAAPDDLQPPAADANAQSQPQTEPPAHSNEHEQ